MINIALNRPATQSSTSSWSTSSTREVDARVANNGDTHSARWFHTSREFRPWWQVDLEDFFLVRRVVIHNRLDARERLKRFSILRSTDGRNWFEVFEKTDNSTPSEFSVEIGGRCLARFIRIRMNGTECLHFRECQIFGDQAASSEQEQLFVSDSQALEQRYVVPPGRSGHFCNIGGFEIFVDDLNYGDQIKRSLDTGRYEGRERQLTSEFILPTDRAIEVGTAIGVVSMTAASIVGAAAVTTYDANPAILADARDNFRRNGLDQIKSFPAILANRQNFKPNSTIDFNVSENFWASRLDAGSNTNDIVRTVTIPIRCLEDEIEVNSANVLICDIEGGEVKLLSGADLSSIRMIIMETHYWATGEAATDAMIRELINSGFSLHLGASGGHVSVLRRP